MLQYSAASRRSRKESAMTGQTANDSAVIPYAPKARNAGTEADQLDRAGHAILGLVSRAADTSEADLRAAQQAAEKLTVQLKAANNQINALTANLRYYQDRTERAEKWFYQISSEIEQRFFGAHDSRPARRNLMR
jgi:septal ring factor EnvC (AmiA/AmiB activator)